VALLDKLKWAARRYRVPVPADALVLEVGSGGNPYPRANVLLDAYEETRERHWEPLIHDRPTVLAFGERLPFKDKAFDFVIAAHVLEHTPDPAAFLRELQRVAKAGYIETPDAFMERINPYKDHRLEVTVRDAELVIRKKPRWVVDDDLVQLYEHRVKPLVTRTVIPGSPFDFHVRYYWTDRIAFRILNEDVDASWSALPVQRDAEGVRGLRQTVRLAAQNLFRRLLSQHSRNRRIDLLPLLRCARCSATELQRRADAVTCAACGAEFPTRGHIYTMHVPSHTSNS
jgi:SAM-dependent methyltransferase